MRVRIVAIIVLFLGLAAGYFAASVFFPSQARFFYYPFRLGLDLKGGTHLLYRADFPEDYSGSKNEAMASLRDVIERRVNLFGVTEPLVQTETSGNENRLVVELAGLKDIQEAKRLIGETPFLEFREFKSDREQEALREENENVEFSLLTQPTGLDGRHLERAVLEFDPQTNVPLVALQFDNEGAKLFEEVTGRNIGKPVAVFLDGSPISVPIVQEAISGGKAQITGSFTPQEARMLVGRLNAGALPVPISLVSEKTVEASLGSESLAKSFNASLWGFLLVVAFMIFWYRLPGLIAVFALCIYAAIVLSVFKLVPVTLSAAAISGFILSVGMAVDANILIFERFKEELKKGAAVETAVHDGFKRAWTSIRDSNVSSIITAVILFWFGTSIIKGFALTLGIGVLISMFSAITVSRAFLGSILTKRFEKKKFLLLSGFNK
ncbi:MAG: protein translocase subunit SecD [Candidatus Sungbacteria bacterium]|nr:protein translocase subunit SecD [Candidatus Sungbacteria bacterium]